MDPTVPTTDALTTFAGATLVTGVIVEFIKRAWRPTDEQRERFLPLLSAAIGVALVLAATAVTGNLDGSSVIQAVVTGLFAGAAGSGAYDVLRAFAPTR